MYELVQNGLRLSWGYNFRIESEAGIDMIGELEAHKHEGLSVELAVVLVCITNCCENLRLRAIIGWGVCHDEVLKLTSCIGFAADFSNVLSPPVLKLCHVGCL